MINLWVEKGEITSAQPPPSSKRHRCTLFHVHFTHDSLTFESAKYSRPAFESMHRVLPNVGSTDSWFSVELQDWFRYGGLALFGQVGRKDSPFFCACLQVYGCRSTTDIPGFSALTFHPHYLWQWRGCYPWTRFIIHRTLWPDGTWISDAFKHLP